MAKIELKSTSEDGAPSVVVSVDSSDLEDLLYAMTCFLQAAGYHFVVALEAKTAEDLESELSKPEDENSAT